MVQAVKRSRLRMPAALRDLVRRELELAKTATDPWPYLERAHIVSQPWAWPHTKVHWAMLTTALGQRDRQEILGQLIRLLVAGPGSLVGRYPMGNTGRTTMGLTETATVPAPLAALMDSVGHDEESSTAS